MRSRIFKFPAKAKTGLYFIAGTVTATGVVFHAFEPNFPSLPHDSFASSSNFPEKIRAAFLGVQRSSRAITTVRAILLSRFILQMSLFVPCIIYCVTLCFSFAWGPYCRLLVLLLTTSILYTGFRRTLTSIFANYTRFFLVYLALYYSNYWVGVFSFSSLFGYGEMVGIAYRLKSSPSWRLSRSGIFVKLFNYLCMLAVWKVCLVALEREGKKKKEKSKEIVLCWTLGVCYRRNDNTKPSMKPLSVHYCRARLCVFWRAT